MMRASFLALVVSGLAAPAFAQDHAHHDMSDHGSPSTMSAAPMSDDMAGDLVPADNVTDADMAAAVPEDAPWGMADAIWGADIMQFAREKVQHGHGDMDSYMVMADRLEVQFADGEETGVWDVQGWYGGDRDKLFIKSEGEYAFAEDDIEDGEIQLLWSRAISAFWDVQAGARYDFEPQGRTHLVLGVQGLAPYKFEIDAAAFLSTQGDLTVRAEAEYEVLLTQRLVLQPRVEVELSAQDTPTFETGAGISGLNAGARLRYEITPAFAPYVGVEWQTAFGDTRNIIRSDGGDPDRVVAVAGIRTWF